MCNTLCKKNVMYITINNHDDRNIGVFLSILPMIIMINPLIKDHTLI